MSNPYLDLLPIVADRGWRVHTEDGHIRDRQGRCPLCALAHEVAGVDSREAYFAALLAAGLPAEELADTHRVAHAADQPASRMRPALMAALGMKP
jgi:hypothetical protein